MARRYGAGAVRAPLQPAEVAAAAPRTLAGLGIVGGAAYDGLVALAALHHDATLVTRDLWARDTYERVGVAVIVP